MKLLLTPQTRVATSAGLLPAGELPTARDLHLIDAAGRSLPGRASTSSARLLRLHTDDGAVLEIDEAAHLDDGTPLPGATARKAQLAMAEGAGAAAGCGAAVTPARAWLAGLLLGGGYAGAERRRGRARPASADGHVWEIRPPTPISLQRLTAALEQEGIPFVSTDDHGLPVIQGSGEAWTLFWRSLGLRFLQRSRNAPDWVWRGGTQLRTAFLRGVAAASPPRGGQGQLASRSDTLRDDIRSLLRGHGFSGHSIEGALSVSASVAAWIRGDTLPPAAEQLTITKVEAIGVHPAVRVETEGRELLVEGLVLRA